MKSAHLRVLSAHAGSVEYPDGHAGALFEDRRSRPMALLTGAMAVHGCKDPWSVPYAVKERLSLAVLRPADLCECGRISITEALDGLHRSPREMGRWLHATAIMVVADFCGDAGWIWNNGNGISASRLLIRLTDLPGIGPAKAMLLIRELDRRWDVKITDWNGLSAERTTAMRRMAARMDWEDGDLDDPRMLPDVYDGMRTLANEYCLRRPACEMCPLNQTCPKKGTEYER